MAKFQVDVENATYEVDAADEKTAWKLANEAHLSQPAAPPPVASAPTASRQSNKATDIINQLQETVNKPSATNAGLMMGIKDPVNAAAQYVSRFVPTAVNEAIDIIPAQLRASTNPIISKLANTLLANPRPEAIDQAIREEERQYQTQRAQVGDSGFDPNRMIGNVGLTAAMGVGTLPAAAVSTIPRLLASTAGLGALSSQLTPAISKEEQANFPATKVGQAKLGMMLGPLGTLGGKALGAVGSNIAQKAANYTNKEAVYDAAKQKLAELLSKSGVGNLFQTGGANPLAQVEARLATTGPNATIAVAGRERTLAELDKLATLPGQAKTLVEQFIRDQQAKRAGRLVTAADEALGTSGKTYTGTLADLIDQKKTIAGPLYKQLEGVSVKVDDDLAALIQSSKTAHGGAELLAQLKGTTPIDISKIKAGDDIPFDSLDKVKQALYDLAEKSKGEFGKPTSLSNAYNDLRISLTSKMDALSPKDKNGSIYKQARDAFAGPSQLEDAVKVGRNAMKEDAIKVADAVKGMTQSEIDAYRVGVLQSLKDKVGTEGGQTSLLKMWKEPATSDKLKEIFGNDYRQFAADVAREARLKTIEGVGRGSQTASRLAAMEEDSLGNVVQAGQAAMSVASGNPAAAMGTMGRLFSKTMTPEATRNELARLLLQKGPAAQKIIQELPADIKFINEKMVKNAALANALAQQSQTPTR
jgi:hypothetical protein